MKTGKTTRIVLGILTGIYAVLPLAFFISWFMLFAPLLFAAGRGDPEPPFGAFQLLALPLFPFLICLLNLLHFGLIIYYVAHMVKNRAGSETLRIVLGVGFLALPWLALPAYYLVYILPEEVPDWALQRPAIEG